MTISAPTYQQFFTAVAQRLGQAHPSSALLSAMAAVIGTEGPNSYYNPYNIESHGDTAWKGTGNWNSVGVQTYGSFDQGVAATAAFLSQNSNWSGAVQAIRTNNPGAYESALSSIYTWAPYRGGSGSSYLSSPMGSGGTGTASSSGSSGGGGTTAGGGVPGSTSLDTYYNVDNLGGLLSAIPDLKALVAQAVAGKWSVEKFTNAVQNSAWWKSHSDTARAVIEERANDPAKWKQDLANTLDSVRRLSNQLGFPVTEARLLAIANNGLLTGNATNSGWLTEQLGSSENYGGVNTSKGLNGQMAQTYSQLQQMAGDYGLTYTPQNLIQFSRDIVIGKQSLDFYKNVFVNGAKSRFPGVSDQLDKGLTLKQIADPYTQTMSQLLEISPESVNLNNPLIKQALQGTPGAKGTTPVQTPLWQFEQSVRSDPRWGKTQNARDTVSSALVRIGTDFGFSV